jgi:hypothetical protein
MPNVAVSTLLVTSVEWLLRTSPQAKGWWLALLGHSTREENGGRIVGAALWGADQWLFVLGKGGSRDVADTLVAEKLAEWAGDDLIVAGYSVEWERSYRQSRDAGKKGAQLKKYRKLAKLAGSEEHDGEHGVSPPASPPASPLDKVPVGSGKAKSGDVGQGDVSESTAGNGAALCHEVPSSSGCPTPATPPDIGSTPAKSREAQRPERSPDPDAPDPDAQLAHCLRAHPGTAATVAEKRALVRYCESLPKAKVQPTCEQLWSYWQKEKSPTVTDWLARQHGVR